MERSVIDRTQIIVNYDKTVAEAYCQFLQSFKSSLPKLDGQHKHRLLKLALKMGLSHEERVALLDSEHLRRWPSGANRPGVLSPRLLAV